MVLDAAFIAANTEAGSQAEADLMAQWLGSGGTADVPDRDPTEEEHIVDKYGADPRDWQDTIMSYVGNAVSHYANNNGYDDIWFSTQFRNHGEGMMSFVESSLLQGADNILPSGPIGGVLRAALGVAGAHENPATMGRDYYMNTEKGVNEMIDIAIQYFGNAAGIELARAPAKGGRGRGRSGPKRPTAEEIRKQFDIEELSNAVNGMNQSLVLEEHANPTQVARDYVEAIVKTHGETKIDFETYVRGKIEATGRFKSIYRNKPEALTAEAYMAPYMGAATQVVGGDEAAEIAIGGAQFGSTAEQFGQRLKRTDAVTGSAGFIGGMESRLQDLNSIFKG